ncbi:peptidase domain-containing ABC transporter [Eilatimonas milleporae]|uniref:ATP-binding cassette subfamily B protein RaxB n=1 Tax=Eilatimonas milleporae TaxID=911205 RepID=A0A3M0CKU7_9PROT|nr:peptidase domain-containing ABC transporter [Eilatimonas milleporae]RMB09010.1 ATP-binding cassette subfamily B protein RaxB [Eilatimonas milleporae]
MTAAPFAMPGLGSKVPVIHQAEAAECGLACLAMIAAYHGYRVDLSVLRRRFPVSLKGASLTALTDMASELSLVARAVRIELEDLPTLQGPAILHWDMSHFLVLVKATKTHAVLHDPARGRVKLPLETVSRHFTGVALELRPAPDFKKREEVQPVHLNDFWSRIRGLKGSMVQAFILSAFLQVFALVTPLYQQMVVDDAITKQDSDFLLVLALGFGLMGLMNLAVTHLRAHAMLYFSNALGFQMTVNLFRHLLRLPLEFFEKRHVGDITSRFGSLAPVKELFTNGIVSVVLDGLMAVGTLIMAFLYSVELTLMVLGFLAFGFLVDWLTFPIVKRKNEDILNLSAKEDSTFLETIRAARAIKIFGQETARESQWQNRKAETLNAQLSLARFNINLGSATGIVGLGQSILVLYMGAHQVIGGAMTLGMLFAYQSYSGQFSSRINAVIDEVIKLRMLKLHLSRLADIVHTAPEITPDDPAPAMIRRRRLRGDIELNNVSYRYGEHEPWTLKNVALHITAGEMVALVGPSGAGKTTLLKILLGLLSPQEGEVRIDGVQLKTLGPQAYRANLGVVMQDDQLLSGSVADNISFFDPLIDMERLETCARLAALDRDIAAMPMGYNSLVGDMGTTLSGGQRQRLLLARALYRKPRLLFLDEGTANLDGHTERHVAKVVRNLPITRVVIAHRPALITAADRILALTPEGLHEVPVSMPMLEAAE